MCYVVLRCLYTISCYSVLFDVVCSILSCLCYVDVTLGCLVAVFCHFDMICMLFDVIMSAMCDVTFRRFVALL